MPISAPTLTRLMLDTMATRRPATTHRDGQRELDAEEAACSGRKPIAVAAATMVPGTDDSASAMDRTSSAMV